MSRFRQPRPPPSPKFSTWLARQRPSKPQSHSGACRRSPCEHGHRPPEPTGRNQSQSRSTMWRRAQRLLHRRSSPASNRGGSSDRTRARTRTTAPRDGHASTDRTGVHSGPSRPARDRHARGRSGVAGLPFASGGVSFACRASCRTSIAGSISFGPFSPELRVGCLAAHWC